METKRTIEVTCPDCRGPLSEIQMEGIREYRCLVGHAYSPRSVLESHSEIQERALWSAVVALEESANLVQTVASQFTPAISARLERQAEEKMRLAADVRSVLNRLEPFHFE